jgi:hypothetical protein
MSEIAIWVVKFVRIFNLKLLSYFLQLKCCNSFGKGCKTTLMLLFHKFYVVNRVVKFFCDALQHNAWKKGWSPTFFKDSARIFFRGTKTRIMSFLCNIRVVPTFNLVFFLPNITFILFYRQFRINYYLNDKIIFILRFSTGRSFNFIYMKGRLKYPWSTYKFYF